MHAICPVHLIILDVIILTLFSLEYKSYAPHDAILLSLLLPRPSQTQTTSTPSRSHTHSNHVHSWFLTYLWPIPFNTAFKAVLSACTIPHVSILNYISLQTDITYPRQNVGADGLMLLNGGIHLSKAVAIMRV